MILLVDINIIFNAPNIIAIITRTIDYFAALIIGISAIQSIIPIMISLINTNKKENKNKNNNFAIKSFINSLLLALELESANAILKMGVFVSDATGTTIDFLTPLSSSSQSSSSNINNFLFFVAVLSVRIAINQTLRKYSIEKNHQ